MENLATKYRPTTFAEVVGQDIPKSVLKKIAMADGIAARSIFLHGSFGSGKSTLCRIFARAMNCKTFKKTGDVCNECDGCKSSSTKNSNLYYEFDSSVVGNVDSIRNLQELFSYVPDGRRVVVFDEIHAATKQALNAMLKMVEEGVPNTIFVFASTEDILPTLKSRSICLDITTIPFDLIKDRVLQVASFENIEITEDIAMTIAVKSAGHMRDALSILQLYALAGVEGLKTSYSLIVSFFRKALSHKVDEASLILQDILKYNIVDVKSSLYLFIRNIFLAKSGEPLYPLKSSMGVKLFNYFFSPVAQTAIKDEVGIELLFRSFLSKLS